MSKDNPGQEGRFKLALKKRDVVCQVCFKADNLEVHHIVTRNNKFLKYDMNNGILLCADHHVYSPVFSAHRTVRLFLDWFENRYPERWEYLQRHKNKVFHKELEVQKVNKK